MSAPELLCMGEPLVEFNERDPGVFVQGFGGDTSNCAIAAARQGTRVGYLSAVGDDAFGDRLLDLWRREGVDTAHVRRDSGHHTGHYFVTHDAAGHRFSYHRAGSAASHLGPMELPAGCLEGVRMLQVSGISQAISDPARDAVFALMQRAREQGVRIAYDTNLRLQLWPLERARETIHAAVAQSQIVLPGLDDARHLTGLQAPDAIADFYLSCGVELVAMTLGRDGVLVASAGQRQRIPGHAVNAVDATAAGDTFDGAFLAELLAGADPVAAARYANAAAALSTTGYGAVAPIPARAQVNAFLV